jgi:hypothetical protein
VAVGVAVAAGLVGVAEATAGVVGVAEGTAGVVGVAEGTAGVVGVAEGGVIGGGVPASVTVPLNGVRVTLPPEESPALSFDSCTA